MSSLSDKCIALENEINSESDPRRRIKLCRQGLGIGRDATRNAETLTEDEIHQLQATLRLVHSTSRGICNPNTHITKLAKTLMAKRGLDALPLLEKTRPKIVGTDTASLAIAAKDLPQDWYEPSAIIQGMEQQEFYAFGTGFDGGFSVCLRLLEGDSPFLDPKEYKRVVEALPPFALTIDNGGLFFGAAENVTAGVYLALETGRYVGTVVSLRSGRGLRLICTLIRSDQPVVIPAMAPQLVEP